MSTVIQLTDFEELCLKYLLDRVAADDMEETIFRDMKQQGDSGDATVDHLIFAFEGIEKKMGEPLSLMPAGELISVPDSSRIHAILQAAATLRAVFTNDIGQMYSEGEAILEAERMYIAIENRKKKESHA